MISERSIFELSIQVLGIALILLMVFGVPQQTPMILGLAAAALTIRASTVRRISFMNSFAIRGQYFDFSTTGQWMWDEITFGVPESADLEALVEHIQKPVLR